MQCVGLDGVDAKSDIVPVLYLGSKCRAVKMVAVVMVVVVVVVVRRMDGWGSRGQA